MGYFGNGFSISVGFNAVKGEEATWHELQATQLSDLELFAPKEPPMVIRTAAGVIHHVVIDEVTVDDGCAIVNTSTVKRIISRKTKSKQARRVWVHKLFN